MEENKDNLLLKAIGTLIDMPPEDFEKEVVEQHIPIGIINSLIIYFTAVYGDLIARKEAIIKMVLNQEYAKDDPMIKGVLEGLYFEMTKIEQKVIFLRKRQKELSDLGVFDTKNT